MTIKTTLVIDGHEYTAEAEYDDDYALALKEDFYNQDEEYIDYYVNETVEEFNGPLFDVIKEFFND